MKRERDEELLREIARRVKELRAKNGLSQDDVYIASGINVTRIESMRYNLTVSMLKRVCDFFHMTVSEFMQGVPMSDLDLDK